LNVDGDLPVLDHSFLQGQLASTTITNAKAANDDEMFIIRQLVKYNLEIDRQVQEVINAKEEILDNSLLSSVKKFFEDVVSSFNCANDAIHSNDQFHTSTAVASSSSVSSQVNTPNDFGVSTAQESNLKQAPIAERKIPAHWIEWYNQHLTQPNNNENHGLSHQHLIKFHNFFRNHACEKEFTKMQLIQQMEAEVIQNLQQAKKEYFAERRAIVEQQRRRQEMIKRVREAELKEYVSIRI
jgi:hypothetical protein